MNIFKLFGEISINNDKANKAIDDTTGKAKGSESKMTAAFKRIGTAVAAYFTVSKIVEFGKALIDLGASAEDAAAKVNTLLSPGTDTTKYFNDMLSASSTTGVAMADFAEAVYSAISASVEQKDAVDFTTKAIMLSKAGFTSASTAVDVLTTAINAYGMSADDATHISDVLITTQNLGKTTVDELASSMGKVIPIASAYGVNLENLSASYAVLTKGGIGTAEATTYTKSMLTELSNTGSKVANVLKKQTGKSFSDLMASGNSLGDVLAILYMAAGEDSTAFANLWSSTEAGTGALALANAGAAEFNDTLEQMNSSTNATEEAYKKVTGTFNQQFSRLKTNLQNVGIQITNKFLPALTDIVSALADNVGPAFEWLSETISNFIESVDFQNFVEGVKTAFTGAVSAISDFFSWLSSGDSSVQAFKIAVIAVISALVAFKTAMAIESLIKSVSGAFSAFNAVLHANPIALIVAAVAGLVAALISLYNSNETVRNAIDSAWNAIKAVFNTVIGAIKGFIDGLISLWESWQPTIQAVWDETIKPAFDTVIGAISGFVQGLIDLWNNWSPKLGEAWETIKEGFETVCNAIKSFIQSVIDAWENWSPTGKNLTVGYKIMSETAQNMLKDPVGTLQTAGSVSSATFRKSFFSIFSGGSQGSGGSVGQGFAKGGVFSKPTFFDTRLGRLEVGEAGAEAVAPIDVLKGYVREAVREANNNSERKNTDAALRELVENLPDMMVNAFSAVKVDVNNREFARLVKAVN